MVDKPGRYWDVDECAWVRYPSPDPAVEIPQQPGGSQQRGIEPEAEADVRSG